MLYQRLAVSVDAYHRCAEKGNIEWRDRHEELIESLCRCLPSGSGLDLGPRLDLDRSTGEKLVFTHCDFHHLNERGFYDGWTEHTITVRPSLLFGIRLSISGRNKNDIKDYLYEIFEHALTGGKE